MLGLLATLAVIALAVGPTNDVGIDVAREDSRATAEMDFEARRAELGLIGSAPMIGLEPIESVTSTDFDARRTELGLVGSAPMVGLERVNHGARIERRASERASGGSVATISSVRKRTQ